MTDKILLVDDDKLVLECFQRVLGRHFSLDTAPGPSEALQSISANGPYAVVVSDMRMPGMNGMQFLTMAKDLAPDTVCILLSGNFISDEIEPGAASVVFKVLEKPIPF